jgi:transposase InsO family protein
VRFVLRASSGKEEMAGLCREFEISRTTGYHWLNRFRSTGRIEDLKELSRRPHSSPNQTDPGTEERIVAARKLRPDWGARKLHEILQEEAIEKPPITIHRVIRRAGLVPPQPERRPATKRFQRKEPNELWQMDFKGLPTAWSKIVAPLSVLDDCTRFCPGLASLPGPRFIPVRDYVTGVFRENGLPDAMLLDHGSPWWSAHHPNGWTQFSIWLMNRDIALHFAAVRHPQTQGKVERFHGSLESALRARGFPKEQRDWPPWLEAFRYEYNHVRPHEALDMATPASRWHPSQRAFPETPRAWEYPLGGPVVKVRQAGQINFAGRAFTVSGALADQWVQLETISADRLLVFYRRTCVREINLQKGQSYAVYFTREQPIFDGD